MLISTDSNITETNNIQYVLCQSSVLIIFAMNIAVAVYEAYFSH